MRANPIKSYRDLEVYQRSYKAMLRVMKELILKLPPSEKYDLKDQVSRSCKAIPRLIAEGFAKKHQKFGFKKYLDDALAESNETIVSIEQSRDIYDIDVALCNELVNEYNITSKQLYKLRESWNNFQEKTDD
ncbi:MAG: four helix bundle protein [Candidatus Liptonbacteria bacterium]|nr:four helix bundle protein [Candidatus Liptonbacteria bacterium]